MAWNPENLQRYEDEMREKRRQQAVGEHIADVEHEVIMTRRDRDNLLEACKIVLARLTRFEMDFDAQTILRNAIGPRRLPPSGTCVNPGLVGRTHLPSDDGKTCLACGASLTPTTTPTQ